MKRLVLVILCCLMLAGSAPAENLALGKKVYASAEPDAGSLAMLTDGVIAGDNDNDTMAKWSWSIYTVGERVGLFVMIDLGQVQSLGSSSIRALNNATLAEWVRLPRDVTLTVSRDGDNFYEVKTWKKTVTYGDMELAENEEAFFVEEQGRRFYHEFAFDLEGIEARYVGLKVVPEFFYAYLDEWKVFPVDEKVDETQSKAKEEKVFVESNRIIFPLKDFPERDDSVFFGPTHRRVDIPLNAELPHTLTLVDFRPKESRGKMDYVIEVPEGVEILETERLSYHSMDESSIKHDGQPYTRYTLTITDSANRLPPKETGGIQSISMVKKQWIDGSYHFGPLYFQARKKFSGEQKARFYAISDEQEFSAVEAPVYTFKMPWVRKYDVPSIGLAWMRARYSLDWPDFIKNYRRIGFNTFPCFAQDYIKKAGDDLHERVAGKIAEARRAGLDILMVDSTLHHIKWNFQDTDEYRCQGEEMSHFCPSYRGPLYEAEMERLAYTAKTLDPDWVFHDIEIFPNVLEAMKTCPVCLAGMKEAGQSAIEYLGDQGTEIFCDVRRAITRDRERPEGLYHIFAGQEHYQNTFRWDRLYPNCLSLSQSSFYMAGMMDIIHERIQKEMELMDKPWAVIPWFTTGTYGEYPPFKVELSVYEALLNGAGMAFFCFLDFEPIEFYYLSKCLKTLEPYRDLLKKGRPEIEYRGGNPDAAYSAFVHEEKGLFMAANYHHGEEIKAGLEIPIKDASRFTDIRTGRRLSREEMRNWPLRPQEVLIIYAR